MHRLRDDAKHARAVHGTPHWQCIGAAHTCEAAGHARLRPHLHELHCDLVDAVHHGLVHHAKSALAQPAPVASGRPAAAPPRATRHACVIALQRHTPQRVRAATPARAHLQISMSLCFSTRPRRLSCRPDSRSSAPAAAAAAGAASWTAPPHAAPGDGACAATAAPPPACCRASCRCLGCCGCCASDCPEQEVS